MYNEEMVNKVVKVIRDNGDVIFIIQTEGDSDLWYWQVSEYEVKNYFSDDIEDITLEQAGKFANDSNNDTLGCSCGGYDSIEEILEELDITE